MPRGESERLNDCFRFTGDGDFEPLRVESWPEVALVGERGAIVLGRLASI